MEVEIAQGGNSSTPNTSYENLLKWWEENRWKEPRDANQDGSDMEVEIDMDQPVDLGFDESDESVEEEMQSEDCSCGGRPLSDSDM